MIVLKIIGIIIGCFLLLLLLLIGCTVGVWVDFSSQELKIKGTLGVFRITVFPLREKKPKKKKTPAKEKTISPPKETAPPVSLEKKIEVSTPKKQETLSSHEEEQGKPSSQDTPEQDSVEEKMETLKEKISPLWHLVKSSKPALNILQNHFIIDKLTLLLKVGGEDAHQTALNFAHYDIAIIQASTALVQLFPHYKVKQIAVSPDFLSPSHDLSLQVHLRIRILFLLQAAFSLLLSYNRNYNKKQHTKGGNQHGKTTTSTTN